MTILIKGIKPGTPFLRDTNTAVQSSAIRMVNFIKSGVKDKTIYESIYKDGEHLSQNLKSGDQVINAKALIFGGIFFDDGRWLSRGKDIFSRELGIRVLEDGGHADLNIMTHSLLLEDILDIINIYRYDDSFRHTLYGYAAAMMRFLYYMTHTGGEIYLFNDAASGRAAGYDKLSEYGRNLGITGGALDDRLFSFRESGYFGIKDEQISFAVDGGALHGHADIFGFEFSYGGTKFITDSSGSVDRYFRSTPAHNTISINDKDQPARSVLGRKFQAEEIKFEHGRRIFFRCGSVKVGSDDEGDASFYFSGVYRGWGNGTVHKREIYYQDALKRITVKDTLKGTVSSAKSFIHLDPGVEIREDGNKLILNSGGKRVVLLIGKKFEVINGRINNKVVVIPAELPCVIEYRIQF
jgi:uncharacterized heparinase superfamily protein